MSNLVDITRKLELAKDIDSVKRIVAEMGPDHPDLAAVTEVMNKFILKLELLKQWIEAGHDPLEIFKI